MSFILNHQYELLYSFGAFFAFFSMLSYITPTTKKPKLKETSLESSDQFFEGFEGPDLESIMSGADLSKDPDDEEASVVDLNGRGGYTNGE
jgi:hypothetical protein